MGPAGSLPSVLQARAVREAVGQVLCSDKIGNAFGKNAVRIIGFGDPIPRWQLPDHAGFGDRGASSGFCHPVDGVEFGPLSEFEVRDPISSRVSRTTRRRRSTGARANAFYAGNVIYTPTGATGLAGCDVGHERHRGRYREPRLAGLGSAQHRGRALQYGVYGIVGVSAGRAVGRRQLHLHRLRPGDARPEGRSGLGEGRSTGDPEKLFPARRAASTAQPAASRTTTTTSAAGKIGTTAYKGEAVIFGNDPVAEIVATMGRSARRSLATSAATWRWPGTTSAASPTSGPTTRRPSPTTASWPLGSL